MPNTILRLTLLLLLTVPRLIGQDSQLLAHFDYDHAASLGVKEAGVEHRGNVTIHDISYVSPKGGRVPAYLVVPSGKGPYAAVIWGHWYMPRSEFLNRKEFLAEAVALAPSGVLSLLTDGPIARPGHVEDKNPLSDQAASDLLQQIIDMRRGADLLLARSDNLYQVAEAGLQAEPARDACEDIGNSRGRVGAEERDPPLRLVYQHH